MSQEERINRDLLFKICFMYFANHILKILGIDEEIVEISPTEPDRSWKNQKTENIQ